MKQGNLSGTQISELTAAEKEYLGINIGVKVVGPISGLLENTNVSEGFVITSVDGKPANSIRQVEQQFELEQGVMIEGIYPDGTNTRYFSRGFQFCD
ncbi:MAG: hypothetical protein DHS20C09_14460 [marine bacterium B5-7]|nr:MAG: hypothetical protein DHS20C09_14460 [marine bacterium B5-7]